MQGNYIHFNPNGKPFLKQVVELREQDLICNSHTDKDQRLRLFYTGNNWVEPITLSHQWLFNLGFHESQNGHMFIGLPGFRTVILTLKEDRTNDCFTAKLVYGDGAIILAAQKHVHQLQNLYQSLVPGKYLELTNVNQWY